MSTSSNEGRVGLHQGLVSAHCPSLLIEERGSVVHLKMHLFKSWSYCAAGTLMYLLLSVGEKKKGNDDISEHCCLA